jgi:K+-transporting ATPase KdpF subunit
VRRAGLSLRSSSGAAMSWIYVLSGVTAFVILIYLLIALLYPEKF